MAAPIADRPPSPEPSFATHAWLRDRHRNVTPGVLSLHAGRLTFVGDHAVVFDESAERSDVEFPWYRFSGELRIHVDGHHHRVRLTPPHGVDEGDDVTDAADGRRAGRVWRTLLAD